MPGRREVSRIEGFSDAVFGFALTLLVVSLEVPQSYAELRDTLGGFVSFAATFAVVMWIWVEHYLLFRKFGLEDATTIYDARAGIQRHTISVGIGVLSLLLVWLLPPQWFWMAGASYFLLGPAHGAFGYWSGGRRERLIASRVQGNS